MAKKRPRPTTKPVSKKTILSVWIPEELRHEMERVKDVSGKAFSEMIRESLLERYGKHINPELSDLTGYIPPPLDEELKWVSERHKALLDRLAHEMDKRIRDINKRVQRALKKKKLNMKDCVNLAGFSRPEKTFKQIIDEWDAVTRKRIEEPSTSTIGQRYMHQTELLLQWILDHGALQKLADQYPYRCLPSLWFGHGEYGKFAVYAIERTIMAINRWREDWRAEERADQVILDEEKPESEQKPAVEEPSPEPEVEPEEK